MNAIDNDVTDFFGFEARKSGGGERVRAASGVPGLAPLLPPSPRLSVAALLDLGHAASLKFTLSFNVVPVDGSPPRPQAIDMHTLRHIRT